jgi:hypothetical protein
VFVGIWSGLALAGGCLDSYELSLGSRMAADAATCERDAGACRSCERNDDCERGEICDSTHACTSTSRCDSESHTCEPCVNDADCNADQICDSDWQRCVDPCNAGNDCRDEDRPLCDRERLACVECVDDGDCRGDCIRGECER